MHGFPKDDPVFPANTKQPLPRKPKDPDVNYRSYWFNSSTRAGVLGCVDSFRICGLTGTRCWDRGDLMLKSDSKIDPESPRMKVPASLTEEQKYPFFLLAASLSHSNAFYALNSQANQALHINEDPADASRHWGGEQQWETEAQKIFKTSLARIQVDMLYLSLGHIQYFRGVGDEFGVPETTEDPDTSIVFPSLGHRNVDATSFICINLICLLVFLSNRRYSTLEKRKDNVSKGRGGGCHDNLWITIVLKKLMDFIKWLWKMIQKVLSTLWKWCSAVWRKSRRP